MKTNLFKVKERKEKRIIIEEEKLKNPFLLFFKRHINFILISGIMFAICLILISTGVAFSLFRGSNDYDISYIEGSEIIDSNNDPSIDDDDIEEELFGEIAREEGIVLQVKTFMSGVGDVISYFTDGSSIIVQADGKIYRVSTAENGEYGVNENGTIDPTAKKILVNSTTTTLMDGTIVTNYSDGTAKVEHKSQTYFVRDDNNVKIKNGSTLDVLAPSGVAPTRETAKLNNMTVKEFTNKNFLIIKNGEKYIVNKNTDTKIDGDKLVYSKENAFSEIDGGEKIYKDGNTISFFTNGSAIITDKNGNITYIKKSGDILISKKQQKIYEIITNPAGYSNSRRTLNASGKKVTYFDNAAAIIINEDGKRQYVEDNEDIIFDKSGNIESNPSYSKQIAKRITADGELAYSFDNGKTQVIKPKGNSYIIDTDKVKFKDEELPEEEKPSFPEPDPDPLEYIKVFEKENKYENDFKNVKKTILQITNTTKRQKKIMITIAEVEYEEKYVDGKKIYYYPEYNDIKRLEPKFVIFNGHVGGVPLYRINDTKHLGDNGENENGEYIIYEGEILPHKPVEVVLSLKVDYWPLNNEHQGSAFIGSIKVYVYDETNR